MNWADWYTDTADVYRVVDVEDGALTRHQRQQVADGVPCRIYQDSARPLSPAQTAATIQQSAKLACGLGVDIRAGDELLIHRGGALGAQDEAIRAFAGEPHKYHEPFGAVIPGLAHQEIELLQQERVK